MTEERIFLYGKTCNDGKKCPAAVAGFVDEDNKNSFFNPQGPTGMYDGYADRNFGVPDKLINEEQAKRAWFSAIMESAAFAVRMDSKTRMERAKQGVEVAVELGWLPEEAIEGAEQTMRECGFVPS